MDDIPALVGMVQEFHSASEQPFTFDAGAMARVFERLIASPEGAVFTTGRGMIAGILSPAYCAPSWVIAVELLWWGKGDGLALLRRFEEWAAEHGADEVRMTSLPELPRAERVLGAKGYAPAEIVYRKVI